MNVLRTSFHESSTTDTMLSGTDQHKTPQKSTATDVEEK